MARAPVLILAAVMAFGTADAARCILLERCLTANGPSNGPVPEHLMTKLMDVAAAADPQADVKLALACPACGTAWQAPFDIGAYQSDGAAQNPGGPIQAGFKQKERP